MTMFSFTLFYHVGPGGIQVGPGGGNVSQLKRQFIEL